LRTSGNDVDPALIGAAIGAVFLVFILGRRRFDVQAVIYFADGRVVTARRVAVLHDGAELYLAGNAAVLAYVRTPPIVVSSFPSGLGYAAQRRANASSNWWRRCRGGWRIS